MQKAYVQNAADEEQVKEAGRKVRHDKKSVVTDLLEVLATDSGRRFIWRYLGVCGVLECSFVAGQPDVTAFNEGKKDIGLQMMAEVVSADPDAYLKMQQEARIHEQKS